MKEAPKKKDDLSPQSRVSSINESIMSLVGTVPLKPDISGDVFYESTVWQQTIPLKEVWLNFGNFLPWFLARQNI